MNHVACNPTQPRKNVIFIGSFRPANDGTVGGQMQACRLLLESPLSELVRWHVIDTTMRSLPPPCIATRALDATRRVLILIWFLLTKRSSSLLVFSSFNKASLLEKGLCCLLGKCFGKRVVLSIRSEVKPPQSRRFRSTLPLRFALQSCDQVICQSEEAASRLCQSYGCRRSQTQIIPNWLNASAFQPQCQDLTDSPKQAPTILYVGWLERFKGIFELLEAAKVLHDRGTQCRVVLCGAGSELETIEVQARELGIADYVECRGWVQGEQKERAFREADVFALPSYSEGFPNALLEAMAWGLPVVTTPVGGIPSFVDDNVNGLFVPPQNSEKLAAALKELVDNPGLSRAIGRRNRKKALECYDIAAVWPRVAESLGFEDSLSKAQVAA